MRYKNLRLHVQKHLNEITMMTSRQHYTDTWWCKITNYEIKILS